MNGLVKVVVLGSVLAAGFLTQEISGEPNLFGLEMEPSQHVMHIRKLSDSDKLRIELEPVWFHLESSEQNPRSESQQVKRQADMKRPYKMYSNKEELARHQQKRRDSRSEHSDLNDETNSYLKDFWHTDLPSNSASSETTKASNSLEEQLENVNLPSCFRKYLHEMYDRNSESVRKLMRCLTERSDEGSTKARRTQRVRPQYSNSQEDDYYRSDQRVRRMPQRKVVRKRKYNDDGSQEGTSDEQLKFEQLFIRSDSDSGGQIFEPFNKESDSESGASEDSSSTDDSRRGDTKPQSQEPESHESEESLYTRDGRLRPVAYRRLPQKYNTGSRQQSNSDESERDSSGEESDES
ncbi:uncharacterized protein LOC126558473 [Anopheles maculipalpis]|uniref:uncharacterized protein LOC126558473 n=1 Tax=Anopheles maculipalpis TaxID=1496333 RepID=UPI002158F10A|nr:uncharacterized protein LOC126558473 [Anopheles maculipalpis]